MTRNGSKPRLVGLAEVAQRAGVSPATASKALNAKSDVNETTRATVEAAARELGYLPNSLARGLMGAKTGTVGVIASDLEARFALPILMGVEDELGTDKVLTFLCDARGDETREHRLINALLARRVDGIIVVGRQTDSRPSLGDQAVPVVYAYAFSDSPADLSLTVDNHQIGRIAAQHLLGLGRKRLVHISGVRDQGAALDRLAGVLEVLEESGLALVAEPLFGDWSESWGRAAAAILLDSAEQVDGMICASDRIARGALDTLNDRRVAVPTDVAVVGVDNWSAIAENSRPALTTVDMDLEKLGRVAARRLLALAAGKKLAGVERLPGSLVIRDSTIPRIL